MGAGTSAVFDDVGEGLGPGVTGVGSTGAELVAAGLAGVVGAGVGLVGVVGGGVGLAGVVAAGFGLTGEALVCDWLTGGVGVDGGVVPLPPAMSSSPKGEYRLRWPVSWPFWFDVHINCPRAL